MNRNYWSAILISFFSYLILANLTAYLSSSAALGYLVADIVSSFLYALFLLPGETRKEFYKIGFFHYAFSTTLVEFLGITLVFILIGLA